MRMKQLIYWNTNVLYVVKYLYGKSQKVCHIESESEKWEWKVRLKSKSEKWKWKIKYWFNAVEIVNQNKFTNIYVNLLMFA